MTNDPDYIPNADDDRPLYCHDCGLVIYDWTTAKHDFYNRWWICATCVSQQDTDPADQLVQEEDT